MKLNFDFHLDVEGNRSLNSVASYVDPFYFNEKKDLVKHAYKKLWEIRRTNGFRDTIIDKVIYNGDQDITELIREVAERRVFVWTIRLKLASAKRSQVLRKTLKKGL